MASNRRRRGHVEELPSGSFRASVYAGVDPLTKKPHYLRETHVEYRDAEKALTRLQNQVDEQRHPKSAITCGRRSRSGSKSRITRLAPATGTET